MTHLLTFNPVNANETNLLFLLSNANFNGEKHTDLSSCDGFLKKLFCAHNKSVRIDNIESNNAVMVLIKPTVCLLCPLFQIGQFRTARFFHNI